MGSIISRSRLRKMTDHLRVSRAASDPLAVNGPLYEPIVRGECITVHVVFVNSQQAPSAALDGSIAVLGRYLIGRVHCSAHRHIQIPTAADHSLRLSQIDSAIAQLVPIPPCSIVLVLAPAIADLPHRGLCRLLPQGGHLICINAQHMFSGVRKILPTTAWWRVVLQHELLHCLGLPASRSRRWRGAHCVNPHCALYARIDLASTAAAAARLRLPAGLCSDCENELKAVQARDSRRIAPDDPYDPIAQLNELVRLNPGNLFVYTERAAGYFNQGRYQDAVSDYIAALALSPADGIALHNRGLAYSRLGNHEQALADLSDAIALAPQLSSRHRSRALAYCRAGRPIEALADLETCMHLDPHDVATRNNMAWLLATSDHEQVRDGSRAIGLARDVCERTEWKLPWALGTLAAAYAESGQYELAVKHQKMAIALTGPSNSETMLRHLELYTLGKPCRDCIASCE